MVILLYSISVPLPCFAKIAPERIALGGIGVGMSMNYVKGVYGEPDRVKTDYSAYWEEELTTHYYGETLEIVYNESDRVQRVCTKGNNGVVTPDGVRVGMSVGVLKRIYGKSDDIQEYETSRHYKSMTSDNFGIRFDLKEGKITQITVTMFD